MGTIPIESGILLIMFALQILAALFACKAATTRNPASDDIAWITALNITILFDATIYIAFYNKRQKHIIHPMAIVFSAIQASVSIFLSLYSDMIAATIVIQITAMPTSFAFISYLFMPL